MKKHGWGLLGLILCLCWMLIPRGDETRSLSSLSKAYDLPTYIHGTKNVPNPNAYNQVVNNAEDYTHMDSTKSPSVLGSVFGKTYRIREDFLLDYGVPDFKNFGTFTVLDDNKQALFTVRANQYFIGQSTEGKNQFGFRFVPIDDTNPVQGAKLIDAYIREHLQLGPKDVFVAPTYFFQSNMYQSSIADLAAYYRMDDGFTHMGAYIGNGQTRNAPNDYHKQWCRRLSCELCNCDL